jgi:hypothetical protein
MRKIDSGTKANSSSAVLSWCVDTGWCIFVENMLSIDIEVKSAEES